MSYTSALSFDLSPVRLSYAAALRGVKPRNPREAFSYAQIGAFTPLNFLCLAASNPQGTFYALIERESLLKEAQDIAERHHVTNVHFISSLDALPKDLDYICHENIDALPNKQDAVFETAEKHLAPNGLLSCRYRTALADEDNLRFLIQEYAPELPESQALEFLDDLKHLGATFFQAHPAFLEKLEQAIATKTPAAFFEVFLSDKTDNACSGTFEVMQGLLPRGFSFAGSADVAQNYLQLSAPTAAHAGLEKCAGRLLYEAIKDFVLNRQFRSDIWVRQPVSQSADPSELFGLFTYGITTPRALVPAQITFHGTPLQLDAPLFTKLIDLMCHLPMSIGDFLQHPSGQDSEPDEVVAAIQVLVACGIAHPMRTHYEVGNQVDFESPHWSVRLNAYLDHLPINENAIQLASPIVGSAVTLPALDALVLQAIQRVGMKNAAGILQPALKEMISKNPALAAQIMDATDPTDEVVHDLLTDTLASGMPRWYAYGLLAA